MKNEDLYVYKKSDFYEDFISSQKEYYEREQVDTLLAEKDREIAELKKKLENVQASAYADSVDAGMRERRLRRALYKACVNWMTNRQCAMMCYGLEARAKKFDKAIAKCQAKVEEYR